MTKFERRFFKSLHEQVDDEREAFEAELDDNTNPEEFDVDIDIDDMPIDAIKEKIDKINELILDIPEDLAKIGI